MPQFRVEINIYSLRLGDSLPVYANPVNEEFGDFLDEVIVAGKDFYAKRKKAPGIKRELYFDWIKECGKKYPQLPGLAKVEWSNAVILSFATYQKLIPSIELYAQNNKLDYRAFFAEVMKKGVSIVPHITALHAVPAKARCTQKIL